MIEHCKVYEHNECAFVLQLRESIAKQKTEYREEVSRLRRECENCDKKKLLQYDEAEAYKREFYEWFIKEREKEVFDRILKRNGIEVTEKVIEARDALRKGMGMQDE